VSAWTSSWQALKKHLKTLKKQFNIPFVKKNTKNEEKTGAVEPIMPFHRGAVVNAIPHSDLNLKTSILTKMFVFLEKNLYLDAIGLHLK